MPNVGAQTFNVRNMPYVNQDDSRYAEAIQDLINEISKLRNEITALQQRLTAAGI